MSSAITNPQVSNSSRVHSQFKFDFQFDFKKIHGRVFSEKCVSTAIAQFEDIYRWYDFLNKEIPKALSATSRSACANTWLKQHRAYYAAVASIQKLIDREMTTCFVNTVSTQNLSATQTSAQALTVAAVESNIETLPSFRIWIKMEITHQSRDIPIDSVATITHPSSDKPVDSVVTISEESVNKTKEQFSKMREDLEVLGKRFTKASCSNEEYNTRFAGFMRVLAIIDTVYHYVMTYTDCVDPHYLVRRSYVSPTPKELTDSLVIAHNADASLDDKSDTQHAQSHVRIQQSSSTAIASSPNTSTSLGKV